MTGEPALRRDLGLAALSLYGVGVVGHDAWLAFVGAAVAALPTGLCYSELASSFPRSAGAAVYAYRTFGRAGLSFLVGFLVIASGVTSPATISHGFAN